jgi:D-glycero-D-manno-heptose 1,7-bisphosphate phosphatase
MSECESDRPRGVVLLDRDGVINVDSVNYVRSVEEWVPLPGSIAAIARLSRAGFTIGIVTNQSGLARGLFDIDALQAMTRELHARTREAGGTIDGVFFCPHGPDDGCGCRKPAPGLLLDACRRFGASSRDVIVVGDSARDLEAGAAIGARTVLVRTGNGERTLASMTAAERRELRVCNDLMDFAEQVT